jgi:DNA-binding transcriptional LysR family regulator
MTEDFNLYPFHVFRLVARSGSVTRAAQELFISQPAVSAHLRALEQRYNAELFERTPRGMQLTQIGARLLEHFNQLFALAEEIPSVIDSARGEMRGEVVIAASSTPGAYCVPELLRKFQQRYAAVHPVLMVGDSAEVLEWLREYRVPLGVVGEMVMDDLLHRVEIGADELQLVVAASDPLARVRQLKPEQVKNRSLLLREAGSSTRKGTEVLLGEMVKHFERVVEIRSTEAIMQAVISGLGLAVLSSWATRLQMKSGLLRAIPDKRFRQSRKFYLVRRRDRQLTGCAAALWESLSEFRK